MATGNYLAFGILGTLKNDLASKQAAKAAGCTHAVIQAVWSELQPDGPGTPLSSSAVTSLINDFAYANQAGLKVFFELAIHYPPSWVYTGVNAVESFQDQQGNVYNTATSASGLQVTNWMWTALGWQYVGDLCNKLAAALGSRVAQCDGVKIGGGFYGELHYPRSILSAAPYSFWGYGTSMQTGVGLATGQVVCPNPGYTIFSGTDDQDSQWLNWYLNGLGKWLMFFIGAMRTAGWSCDFYVCHPGYGVRSNVAHTSNGYKKAAAIGEDHARMIGVYAHDPRVWPYCTWLNTVDGYDPVTVDSDMAAWKKIYKEAYVRNKHYRLWGENTGGENTAGLQAIFSGGTYGSALSGNTYNLAPPQTYGYQGIFWLNYTSLTTGSSNASLSDMAAAITAHVATL